MISLYCLRGRSAASKVVLLTAEIMPSVLMQAMTKPDRTLIAEVMLFSQGFSSAGKLSEKLVPLFKLCQEQLSPQSHYDFTLRALKSVLVSAGNVKRLKMKGERTDLTSRFYVVNCCS